MYVFVDWAGSDTHRSAYADLGETLTSHHRLESEATDLELTQQFGFASMRLLAGAGVRIASMEQRFRAEVFNAGGGLEEVVTNDLDFDGAGPTVSLLAARSLATSCFSVYGRMRGSLLIGETDQTIFEMKNAGVDQVADVARQREVLTVAELAIGVQYSRPLGSYAHWFLRSGYECQAWLDAGGPVDSDSTISLDGISLAAGLDY